MQVISGNTVQAAPGYNETEIRFHVVDPIIRKLGYPDHDNVYLNLEEKLEYPYAHIGRRSKKDVPLGFPDYRAGLKGARGSFVIEAKGGSVSIASLEVEQAHSYAAHAQVGANYFVLCNGSAVLVYETLSGPGAEPLAILPLNEVNDRFHELENILAPASLAKNCHVHHDMKLKLAEGLGSSVEIRSGNYQLSDYHYRFMMNGQDITAIIQQAAPQLDQQLELMKTSFELRVVGGIAERGEDGYITANVEFSGATIHNQQAMELMGITEASFATADEFISTDPDSPTIFESTKDFAVSKGAMIPQLFGGASPMESDLAGDMFIKAAMHYRDGKILGEYIALSDMNIPVPNSSPMVGEMSFSGTFELTLGT
ncbi:type I restriction enzyme HsdR N-terminal domain-containing protein [uncultured Pseudophaeobacter sp.]|jgi:hypothetical protein|uniref:type I restriction enzyme HsdR N-terminal domain-containing protein n=1 Tax=uncultured Pseudophaeobacter sp. TaxID=1759421 RepID=UPI0025EE0F2C|nr:type I restriction enzyme HsdR N-terminal domain-containing protein [uncultured Pseudophaeobacter sp.]